MQTVSDYRKPAWQVPEVAGIWWHMQGLTEPFEQKYKDIRSATILTIVASSSFCGVLGFALGRCFGGRQK